MPRRKSLSVKGYFNISKTTTTEKTKPMPVTLDDEYVAVLAVLRSNVPASLPGRNEHIERLDELLRECVDFKRSCSIYIYGAPGHGKTASVKSLVNRAYVKINMNVVYVDCRRLITAVDIYREIVSILDLKSKPSTKLLNITKIRKLIEGSTKPTLLILDEMDRLKTRTNSVLYSLLELRSTVSEGQIAIIGIGNTQNFIDTLPLLKNNDILKPTLMEFASYTKDDIVKIISERLNTVAPQRLIFADVAIEFLAAKTASFGDARISLGLASAAVREAFNKASDDICKVDLFTVMNVFNATFGTNEKKDEGKDTIDLLPLAQQLIISSALIVLKKNICAAKDLTLTHIYNQYTKISTKKGTEVLSQSDFFYACRMIELQGIFIRKKSSKKAISWDDKVLLEWDRNELMDTLSVKPFLSDIFRN